MVKYYGTKYRCDRKEYSAERIREFGPPAESPNGNRRRKVRPGANVIQKVINESGTAAKAASCAVTV